MSREKDPNWLKEIDAREADATKGPWEVAENPGHIWIEARSPSIPKPYICASNTTYTKAERRPDYDFIACQRTAAPLMRDMLRLLADALEYVAGSIGEVSDKDAARKALAAYQSGELPKGTD